MWEKRGLLRAIYLAVKNVSDSPKAHKYLLSLCIRKESFQTKLTNNQKTISPPFFSFTLPLISLDFPNYFPSKECAPTSPEKRISLSPLFIFSRFLFFCTFVLREIAATVLPFFWIHICWGWRGWCHELPSRPFSDPFSPKISRIFTFSRNKTCHWEEGRFQKQGSRHFWQKSRDRKMPCHPWYFVFG